MKIFLGNVGTVLWHVCYAWSLLWYNIFNWGISLLRKYTPIVWRNFKNGAGQILSDSWLVIKKSSVIAAKTPRFGIKLSGHTAMSILFIAVGAVLGAGWGNTQLRGFIGVAIVLAVRLYRSGRKAEKLLGLILGLAFWVLYFLVF